ncbi:VCBS repeat-containing protein [Mucilaginibacter pallidiroseus]|uniref:VCBS repeat-containing protein n=1 Tax=Mucilaginibacter pallidiroseus TaxID=2599295 RepID=A0A563U3C7_9SPHI|nr:VCBS repeat-containing protein [Mucilaginibacter pallidiroseus]TWR25840.1 VCBS repeat-containing protein [Mucilaginibacter pallidiroseus]
MERETLSTRIVRSISLAIGITAVTAFSLVSLQGCKDKATRLAEERIDEGRELSQKYCKSCHQYPSPALLDKTTWQKGVLPAMARQLGLQNEMGMLYADRSSLLSVDDYNKIVEFYKIEAPDTLALPKPNSVKDWAMFAVEQPAKVDKNGSPAMTTLIKFNPLNKRLYSADMANNLLSWDNKLKSELVATMPSAVTAANFYKNAAGENVFMLTCIGILPPNDELKGLMQELVLNGKSSKPRQVFDSLPRPVQTATGDFNKDGLADYVTCGFGNTKGGLFAVMQQPDGSFKKQVIRAVPGAIQVEVGDFNNDGWPDIMCLFAQADEGIWVFLNNKKGGFETRNLLRFPPVYGSNSFQLADINNDGKKDIIYTCGDNNDYSSVLKPYHGLYIFINQDDLSFKQTYFYHINGASKAMAADFDGDGDLDIATIAFFADFKYHPTEGFILMEQTAPGKFKPHELPLNKYGRWIAMEVADVDGDGDQDVVLGNFSVFGDKLINQKGYKPDWDMREPIILLRNKSK